ncbi:MAG: hypothetical protein PVI83_05140 [Lysobacterales bacterium]|jgi:hypothetical protein
MGQNSNTSRREQLHRAIFEAIPLRNVVGIGNMSAWQIHLTRGPALATLGQVEHSIEAQAANAARYE